MKILITTESFLPYVSGVATAAKNLADNLADAGHEAVIATPGKVSHTTLDKKYSSKYSVFRVKSIPNPFRPGFRVTTMSKAEAMQLLREVKPEIIHLQDPVGIGRAFREAGIELGIPVVITNHFSLEFALSYVKFLGPLLPTAEWFLIKYLVKFYDKCDQVVTPTETFRRQIKKWGVKTPVYAISNGIFIEQFLKKEKKEDLEKIRVKYHLPDNPLVLYLGRIDKDKSIDVLVKAIPLVVQDTNAHFVIAGKGGEVENIQKLALAENAANDMTLLGFIDHHSPDFARLYKSAALFAIPSTIETQSLVTLEAMSCGLPVVAADANALPEIVLNNKNGFLFPPGNSKNLAEKIVRILKKHKLAERFGKESVKIALRHEMPRAFAEMVALYELIIDRTSKENNLESQKIAPAAQI